LENPATYFCCLWIVKLWQILEATVPSKKRNWPMMQFNMVLRHMFTS